MLHCTDHPLEEDFLYQLVSRAKIPEGLLHLVNYFENTGDFSRVQKVLRRIPKLKKWSPYLLASLRHLWETRADWKSIQDEGERFFLALLHSLTEKKPIEQLIKAYCPARTAEACVKGWLKTLVQQKKLGIQLNETGLEVFGMLFRGYGEDEICQKVSEIYDVKKTHGFQREIRKFSDQLRSLELLKPLLVPAQSSPGR